MTDNLELPGLPAKPAKRGRPSTGQAMTPAERKRQSRQRAREHQVSGFQDLTDSQLLEAIGRELAQIKRSEGEARDNCKWHLGRLMTEFTGRVDKL